MYGLDAKLRNKPFILYLPHYALPFGFHTKPGVHCAPMFTDSLIISNNHVFIHVLKS